MTLQQSPFNLVVLRVLVGFGFTIFGLQLFTGPPTVGERAWATLFFVVGLSVLSLLAAYPVKPRVNPTELGSLYLTWGKTAADASVRSRAFFRFACFVAASAVAWLLLWVSVIAETTLVMYGASVPYIFGATIALSLGLLAWSFVLKAIGSGRKFS